MLLLGWIFVCPGFLPPPSPTRLNHATPTITTNCPPTHPPVPHVAQHHPERLICGNGRPEVWQAGRQGQVATGRGRQGQTGKQHVMETQGTVRCAATTDAGPPHPHPHPLATRPPARVVTLHSLYQTHTHTPPPPSHTPPSHTPPPPPHTPPHPPSGAPTCIVALLALLRHHQGVTCRVARSKAAGQVLQLRTVCVCVWGGRRRRGV